MKIVVTGGSGLVGTKLKKHIPDAVYLSSKDFDLRKEQEVIDMYDQIKPDCVVHLAAKVGGIFDNINNPYSYFTDNILMNTLLVNYAHKYNVDRFIGMLSTCIYPDIVSDKSFTEDMLHLGAPPLTNFSYGYAKRSLAVQIDTLNSQFGRKYNYIIPCNLYGEGDKDGHNSHYVAALIKKIWEANINNENHITLFGDGTPIRQFMYADDLARVLKYMIDKDITESFNVANDEIYTIKEIAEIALDTTKSLGINIEWDISKPNGQFKKDVSIEKLKTIMPNFKFTTLREGISNCYNFYKLKENSNVS